MAASFDSVLLATRHGPMWALRTDAYITRCLEIYGEYCEAEADLFRQLVQPGMTVVEAGANIGAHTVMLARACAPGRLIAFEPQQRAFQLLCTNLTLNEIANVTAYPEALGAAAGVVELPAVDYAAAGNFGSVSPGLAQDGGEPWREGRTVRLRPLDSLELPACGLLKVDVEGWEAGVLRGAQATIARCRPILYVENDRAAHQAELIALIDALGYAQYWHVAPLFSTANYNGVSQDITNAVASMNMLCVPAERDLTVIDLERIDPQNWRSPMKPIGA
jgi:FkbM family methyltransferase